MIRLLGFRYLTEMLLVIDDNKFVCGSLDGTTRIWNIEKLIAGNSNISDFKLYSESQK